MSTTSSSPKRLRTTASSSRFVVAAAALLAGCQGGARETFITYFNATQQVSVRHPSGWRTDEAEQDGIWYRYFLAPPAGPQRKAAVSVTLLAGPLEGELDEYAQRYLAGNTESSSGEEDRQGARGRTWTFSSPDGRTRHRLLLVADDGRVWGLFAQGEAVAFAGHVAILDEMWTSFTLERPELYPKRRWDRFGVALGIPWSWRETQSFSGQGKLLVHFASPPLAVDEEQPLHASLTMTVEDVPEGSALDDYYQSTRANLGENFAVLSHGEWGGGYVDLMRTETSMAATYVKRFYRVEGGRGCSLAFEARDDMFWRVDSWSNIIASTLRMGSSTDRSR